MGGAIWEAVLHSAAVTWWGRGERGSAPARRRCSSSYRLMGGQGSYVAEGLDGAGLSSGGGPGQAVPHGGGAVGGVSSRVGGVQSLLLGQRQHHGVGLGGGVSR